MLSARRVPDQELTRNWCGLFHVPAQPPLVARVRSTGRRWECQEFATRSVQEEGPFVAVQEEDPAGQGVVLDEADDGVREVFEGDQ